MELASEKRPRRLANVGRGDHERRTEELLGESPVLCGRPAPDVTGSEQLVGEDPWILDRSTILACFEREDEVEAAADTRQPAMLGKAQERPCRGTAR